MRKLIDRLRGFLHKQPRTVPRARLCLRIDGRTVVSVPEGAVLVDCVPWEPRDDRATILVCEDGSHVHAIVPVGAIVVPRPARDAIDRVALILAGVARPKSWIDNDWVPGIARLSDWSCYSNVEAARRALSGRVVEGRALADPPDEFVWRGPPLHVPAQDADGKITGVYGCGAPVT